MPSLISCPHCGGAMDIAGISAGAVVCPFCSQQFTIAPAPVTMAASPFSARQRQPPQTHRHQTNRGGGCGLFAWLAAIFSAICVAVVVLVCGGVLWLGKSLPPANGGAGAAQGSQHANPRRGDNVYLAVPGNLFVLLPINEKVSSRLNQLMQADDQAGVGQLVDAGLVTFLPVNTMAKVIEPGLLTHEVRVIAGSHSGTSGIIAAEFVFFKKVPVAVKNPP